MNLPGYFCGITGFNSEKKRIQWYNRKNEFQYRICKNKEKISFKIKNQCCTQKNVCREIKKKQQSSAEKSEDAANLHYPDGGSKYRMLVWNK